MFLDRRSAQCTGVQLQALEGALGVLHQFQLLSQHENPYTLGIEAIVLLEKWS
jgi:hypothetical protein